MSAEPAAGRLATGLRGVVATGHRLATEEAMRQLRAGGNTADAAVAAAAVQTVVELPWCGLGGDAFVLVHTPAGQTLTYNGSGAAPARIADVVAAPRAPRFGPRSVAVPGAVDALGRLADRFASRPFGELLGTATALAADGFPADERLAAAAADKLPLLAGEHPALAGLLAGIAGRPGTVLRQPELATTLGALADEGPRTFYEGALAARIAATVLARGGALSAEDLASHGGRWEEPVRAGYRGRTVLTNPPVSFGLLLLQQLRLLDGFDLAPLPADGAEVVDLMVRTKLAVFADALPQIGDPAFVDVPVPELLSDERVARLRAAVRAGVVPAAVGSRAGGSDTTSLAVTDGDGMTVVVIHSLFNEFGSRELVDGTGVLLGDRMANQPPVGGRRPAHTLNAYLVVDGDTPVLAGATPGGRGQVQTNAQVISQLLDRGLGPLAAVDAPRWLCGTPRNPGEEDVVHLEWDFGADRAADVAAELVRRGHRVRRVRPDGTDMFGNCTVVAREPGPGPARLTAVADGRRAGAAAGW